MPVSAVVAGIGPSRPVPWFQHLTGGGDELSIAEDAGLVVGVDTHRDTHSAALCDARGRVLAQLQRVEIEIRRLFRRWFRARISERDEELST